MIHVATILDFKKILFQSLEVWVYMCIWKYKVILKTDIHFSKFQLQAAGQNSNM